MPEAEFRFIELWGLWRNCCLHTCKHIDVIKWKHFPRYWPFVQGIHRSPVNSPHKGQWHGALICAWTNGWANNRGVGDLRHHRALYDMINLNSGIIPVLLNLVTKYLLSHFYLSISQWFGARQFLKISKIGTYHGGLYRRLNLNIVYDVLVGTKFPVDLMRI